MFTLPTECSSCCSILHYDGVNLWCKNIECPAQTVAIASNFFKVMEIKGFGPSTCEKLGSVNEILALSKDSFIEAIGQANGCKLYDLIAQAKLTKHDGAKILAALSIPSVGSSTSVKLASTIINGELVITEQSLVAAAITPASRAKILNWFNTDFINIWGGTLPLQVKEVSAAVIASGPTVCVTGKISGHTRDSIASYLLNTYGCKVVSGVTSKVSYLIADIQSNSSSFTKAQSLGIPILTLNQFEEILK